MDLSRKHPRMLLQCQTVRMLRQSLYTQEMRISHERCIRWTMTMLEALLPSYRQTEFGRVDFDNDAVVEDDHS